MNLKKDRKFLVLGLLATLMVLATGYAIFSETLNISGTANTTGTFNVEFSAASLNTSSVDSPGATAVISGDKNTLTLNVPTLHKPSSYVLYDVTVRNAGTINAELLSVNFTGNTDPDITITYPAFPTGTVLAAGATYSFTVRVEWNPLDTDGTPKTLNFGATLNYQQEA